MSETGTGVIPEAVAAAIERVPVDVGPGRAAVMTEAGEGRLSYGNVVRAARLVVATWVTAVNGDGSALRALAEPGLSDIGGSDDDGHDAAYDLLNPVRKDWVIARDPEVTGIELRRLDRGGDIPELSVGWRFTGFQRYGGPVIPPGWTGSGGREYVGSAYLAFDESRSFPWRMSHGHVETVDEYYGYKFTARDETPEEYRTRTSPAGPLAGAGLAASTAALVRGGTYRLLASFAEHDHKFSGDATSDVDSDVPLTRDEASRLAEQAIDAEARRRMASVYPVDGAEMEVRPSLNVLQVIRLLELAPPVESATGPDGAGVDDFARRYAASRGLTYPDEREPAWRDPGPWFLATLNIPRSQGLIVGGVGDGPVAELGTKARGVAAARHGSGGSSPATSSRKRAAPEGSLSPSAASTAWSAGPAARHDRGTAGPHGSRGLRRRRASYAAADRLSSQNRYAVLYRIHAAKRSDTRARRIERFVAMLARGETIHPQGKAKQQLRDPSVLRRVHRCRDTRYAPPRARRGRAFQSAHPTDPHDPASARRCSTSGSDRSRCPSPLQPGGQPKERYR